jgi:glycosyltransferase involved in cell wall biosynthesis
MKIGIDARFLSHPQMGGFKTYTENLIGALGQVDTANQYILYLDRLPMNGELPRAEQFSYKVAESKLPGASMPIREQIILRHCINQDKPEVVHFLCNTAPVGCRRKYIVTLHDTIQVAGHQTFKLTSNLAYYKQWGINAYSKWSILKTARFASRIITVSGYERDQIAKQLEIDTSRISVTYLAPNRIFKPASLAVKDAWRADVHKQFGLEGRFILGVGYEPRKNIPLLMQAFTHLAPDEPDLNLVIVAAQPGQRSWFQKMANDLGLEGRTTILGLLPPTSLAMLYNLAELFVFPSERESFGLPPLEAIACGTPTIAMRMSSLPEILQDGALLVEGKESQHWAQAMRRVVRDKQLRAELHCRGLRRAAYFTWQRCAQETAQIYSAVAEER